MNTEVIIWLLFAHWIADFILQTDEMAQGKSKSNMILFRHCLAYGCGIWLVCAVGIIINLSHIKPIELVKYSAIVASIHFPVDYVTSRINKNLRESGHIHWFFVGIGFDQWIHFVTLILVYKWMGGQ